MISGMEPAGIVAIVIAVALGARLIAGAMDGDRIDNYMQERGCRILAKSWTPFGEGWVGERNARIYEIDYEDQDGRRHRAGVKTSLFSGVYLTNDRILSAPDDAERIDELERLRQENERLRASLERRET